MTGIELPQFGDASIPEDERITYFGITDSRNKKIPFGIKREDRSRHTYIIGKTGMGKSTILENMAAQDILSGEGMCFIDPHGSAAEKLLNYIPEHRVKDVLYFAPFDMEYPISFNVLENVDADKRHLVVAGLMSTFEKIWVDAWSSRMAYILQNTLAALLEFPDATILSVNRMYIDKEYRKNVVAKITDASVRSFWVDEYTKYTDRYTQEATPAIQNKIGQFASNSLVRNVIGQPNSSFDIRKLMDEKKVLIVNLSKGRVGEGNANLLGAMLITKVYLAAMSRADRGDISKLPPFFLHVDEFQNFANRSFADILSEARKYKLSLTIAHQYIEQMDDEVRAAVFGNVGTMMTFRVGAYDADVLEKEFAPVFYADDLVNLGKFQIYLKLMIDEVSSQPFSATTIPPIPEPEENHRDRAIAQSRAQYSKPREEVAKNISDWVDQKYVDPDKDAKDTAKAERREARKQQEQGGKAGFPNKNKKPKKAENEEYKKDLRNLLSKMTDDLPAKPVHEGEAGKPGPKQTPKPPETKPEKKKFVESAVPTSPKENVQNVKKAPPTVENKKPIKKDDGKGITMEGKQELRDLLSKVTNTKPEEKPKTEVPVKPPTNLEPRSDSTQVEDKKSFQPSQERKARELSKEKMEEMLDVKKPNL